MKRQTKGRLCSRCGTKPPECAHGSMCRDCQREYQRAWRAANLETARRASREYYARNKERERRRVAIANGKNPDARREAQKKYYYTNRDAILFRRKLKACGIEVTR